MEKETAAGTNEKWEEGTKKRKEVDNLGAKEFKLIVKYNKTISNKLK